ncbi:5362_t:CDS:1, partial [Racocetra fulgida]
LIHVNEEDGIFYTHSPFVQDMTYIGKGIGNTLTHRYLLTLDGCTNDCTLTVKLEIGRNYSKTAGGYSCKLNSSVSPVDVSSVNSYFGDTVNPKHPVTPSIVLAYCSVGISVDNPNLNFTPTTDAFKCLDSLNSVPYGTHLGLLQIGQDIMNFYNLTTLSPGVKSLANAINNYAKIFNSIALGLKDGSDNALN